MLKRKPCPCDGTKPLLLGVPDWFERLFRSSRYFYFTIGAIRLRNQREAPRYYVRRRSYDEGVVYEGKQCICGAWLDFEEGQEPSLNGGVEIEFQDPRAADEYARRMRNGVPQNWEIAVSVVGGSLIALGEILARVFFSTGS